MGRVKIAEKSAVAHFRVDIEHKQFLEDFARKQGTGFSDLARDAVKKYAEALREEREINRLRGSGKFKDLFSEYDRAIEVFSKTQDLSLLDAFISSIQKQHEKESKGAVLPEIKKLLSDLKLDIAHRYLIFTVQYMTWKEQLRTSLPYLFPESEARRGKPRITKKSRPLQGEIKIGDKLEKGGEGK